MRLVRPPLLVWVLADGTWHQGLLEAWDRDSDGWRAFAATPRARVAVLDVGHRSAGASVLGLRQPIFCQFSGVERVCTVSGYGLDRASA